MTTYRIISAICALLAFSALGYFLIRFRSLTREQGRGIVVFGALFGLLLCIVMQTFPRQAGLELQSGLMNYRTFAWSAGFVCAIFHMLICRLFKVRAAYGFAYPALGWLLSAVPVEQKLAVWEVAALALIAGIVVVVVCYLMERRAWTSKLPH